MQNTSIHSTNINVEEVSVARTKRAMRRFQRYVVGKPHLSLDHVYGGFVEVVPKEFPVHVNSGRK